MSAPLAPQLHCNGQRPALDLMEPIRNGRPGAQPWGGIWTSTYDAELGSAAVQTFLFWVVPVCWLMTPSAAARVATIDSADDLEALGEQYGWVDCASLRSLNFERLAGSFDAVHVTERGLTQCLRHWVCEQTIWFRWCFEQVKALGAVDWPRLSHLTWLEQAGLTPLEHKRRLRIEGQRAFNDDGGLSAAMVAATWDKHGRFRRLPRLCQVSAEEESCDSPSQQDWSFDNYRVPAGWFHNPTGLHGTGHAARVLCFANLLAEACRDVDIEVVRVAAAVHDVGRVSDGLDLEHGQRSAAWFRKNVTVNLSVRRRQAVAYCVEWHVPPDSAAPKMTPELQVLKDADGLDRLRFDGLDPTMLRTEAARGMIGIARALVDDTRWGVGGWDQVRRAAAARSLWR